MNTVNRTPVDWAIPFQTDEGGNKFITKQQLESDPGIYDFYRRYCRYFTYDVVRRIYWFDEKEADPTRL